MRLLGPLVLLGLAACVTPSPAPTASSPGAVQVPQPTVADVPCPGGGVPFVPQRMEFEAGPTDDVIATVNGVRISRQSLIDDVGERAAAPVVRSADERRRMYKRFIELIEPLLWQQELLRLGRPVCPARVDFEHSPTLEFVQEAVLAPHYYPLSEQDLTAAHAETVALAPPAARWFVVLERGTHQALAHRAEQLRRFSPAQLESLEQRSRNEGTVGGTDNARVLAAPSGLFGPIAFEDDEEHSVLLFLHDLQAAPTPPTIDQFRIAARAASERDLFTDGEEHTEEDPLIRAYSALDNVRGNRRFELRDAELARLVDQAQIEFDDGAGTTWQQLKLAGTAPPVPRFTATGPVAIVDGVEIPRVEVDRAVESYLRLQQRNVGEERVKAGAVAGLVDRQLVAARAKAEGVVVTPDELAAAWGSQGGEAVERYTRLADEGPLVDLKQAKIDAMSALNKSLLLDKLAAKVFATQVPTEADARRYYDEHVKEYTLPEQIEASVSYFSFSDEKKRNSARAEAKKVLEKLQAGVPLAEAAPPHGDGSFGPYPERYTRGELEKAVETLAFAAKPGSAVGPVEPERHSRSYTLVYVHTHTDAYQFPFDEVKASILRTLKARHKANAPARLLAQLQLGTTVEVLEPGVAIGHICREPAACPGYRLGGAAAAAEAERAARLALPDIGPVAVVNGAPIRHAMFVDRVQHERAQRERWVRFADDDNDDLWLKSEALRELVEEELVAQRARADGIALTEAELATVRATPYDDRMSAAEQVANLTRTLLFQKIVAKALAAATPTDVDLKRYWESNSSQLRIRHSLKVGRFSLDMAKFMPDEEMNAIRAKAMATLASLRAGASFEETAKAAPWNGRFPGPRVEYVARDDVNATSGRCHQLGDACLVERHGEYGGVIEVMIVLDSIDSYDPSFDEMRDVMYSQLTRSQKKLLPTELLEQLKRAARVELRVPGVPVERVCGTDHACPGYQLVSE
jgi:hypothetical protein